MSFTLPPPLSAVDELYPVHDVRDLLTVMSDAKVDKAAAVYSCVGTPNGRLSQQPGPTINDAKLVLGDDGGYNFQVSL
jgi:hypothetical protein